MALASFGASTPFITSRPSNAMTLASVAEEVRLGLAGADAASALFEFASGEFAIFASLLSAKTGATEMANTSRVDRDFLSVNMDGGSWFSGELTPWLEIWSETVRQLCKSCQVNSRRTT